VLLEAYRTRVERGDHNIAPAHLADAIERLVLKSRKSLSEDRTPRDPHAKAHPAEVSATEPDESG
jgi:hypothetical protein